MMHRAFGRAVFAAMLLWPVAGVAGPIADRAADAEALLTSGKAGDALAAFDQAAAAFWEASPLQLRVAAFADSVSGFGDYAPRPDASFKTSDKILLYLEPVGYAFTPDGDQFKVALAADVEVRSPKGLVFGKADDFAHLTWTSRAKLHEVHATISTGLPALKPGDYVLVLTLRDQASPKTATVDLPFKVVGE